ncbi:MAG: acyl-CoA dehydrogenase [Caldilineae bacterium]|nr:MAG: acyl-CoA dehydrogenase [Caldilineae bacterium]
MTNNLTQTRVREVARAFVEREIPLELAREIDRTDRYPADLLDAFGRTGLFGVNIAAEYGGLGGAPVDALPIYEEISRRLPVLAWVIGNIILYGNDIIGTSGSPAQKEAYLPRLARGELRFSFALTEPNAGSDAAGIQTRAVFEDGSYWITGSKMFITGAGVSDIVVTMTRTAPDKYRGITAFLVKTSAPGYSARPLEKLGYHGSNTCAVHYDNVRADPDDILGGPECLNRGWGQMVKLLNSERLSLAACSLGIGQAVLDEAVAFARERFRFSQARGRYQAVQHALVDMATELEAARRLTYHAAQLEREGAECVRETSMAKYFASETARKIALRAVELMGRAGGTFAVDAQRFLRDVQVLCIGGGTTQIQKNIVAKTMGL